MRQKDVNRPANRHVMNHRAPDITGQQHGQARPAVLAAGPEVVHGVVNRLSVGSVGDIHGHFADRLQIRGYKVRAARGHDSDSWLNDHGLASIDHQGRAIDVRCSLGDQKQHSIGNIVNGSDSARRDGLDEVAQDGV